MSVTSSSFHLSDATKPSQTGMTGEGNAGMAGERNTGMTVKDLIPYIN
ncbi:MULTISPECIES: hypothetical protein [unclassified Wolbachia]|nr:MULTISPECIES: hypothetical protein [unclassified Wolbachia]